MAFSERVAEAQRFAKMEIKDLEEKKTLSFEWFVSADGKEATLIESFSDSDGAKQRAENLLASPIAQEWGERFEHTN